MAIKTKHDNMKKNTNHSTKKRKRNIVVLAIVLAAVILVGGLIYLSLRAESPDVAQGRISKDEAKSDSSTKDSSPSGSTATPAMTPESPATPPAVIQPNSLPTPVLAKSSGNNGSIPAGAIVNFTCTSAPGYFCEVTLQKPGASSITLERKQLTGEMGQSFASWNWESLSGTWSITAVLSNSGGQTKSSAAQALEVR